MSRHGEVTGVDTLRLRQLDRRTVQGCRRGLTLSRRDADLQLVVLAQRSARGDCITVVGDGCGATAAGRDCQGEGGRLVLTASL